jgi:hypothetical protein
MCIMAARVCDTGEVQCWCREGKPSTACAAHRGLALGFGEGGVGALACSALNTPTRLLLRLRICGAARRCCGGCAAHNASHASTPARHGSFVYHAAQIVRLS